MSGELLCLKNDDDFTVEFDLLYPDSEGNFLPIDIRRIENLQKIFALNQTISDCQERIKVLNEEIDRLTNHADRLDYLLAVASGTLTGLLDIFFVGELDMATAKANVHKKVNQFIEDYARSLGYKGKKEKGDLSGAIDFLEKKFKVAQDDVLGSGTNKVNHHLDDLAHHPTPVGLLAAIVVQFFRVGIFVNKDGDWHIVHIETEPVELVKIWAPVFITGILRWLVNLAKSKYQNKFGKELPGPVVKIVKLLASAPVVLEICTVIINWRGHLISDLGGSKNSARKGKTGMGLPGFFLSLLKEISSVPPLNYTQLPQIINELYTKEKIDLRTELAFISELGRQAVPVIINELIVRTFYFVRRLLIELGAYKSFKEVDWGRVNWRSVVPFNNRTITRMITIASGTFTAIDMADAAIRAAAKSGGNPAVFWGKFALRVNFVGVGRFVIALGTDFYMGYQRKRLIAERMTTRNYLMVATNAKMFYYEANMWISAQQAGEALHATYEKLKVFYINYSTIDKEFKETSKSINHELDHMEKGLDFYKQYLTNLPEG